MTESPIGLPGGKERGVRLLVIGCGNLLRGDDGVGPEVVRRLVSRGLPAGVEGVDAATAGIDVALAMRAVPHAIVVDACRSGVAPGTLIELSGADLEELPPPSGISVHGLRWDHALAFARWRLGGAYPARVTVLLIEGGRFGPGESLSPAVEVAVEEVCRRILDGDGFPRAAATAPSGAVPSRVTPLPADDGMGPASGWLAGPRVGEVPEGKPLPFMAGDVPGIVVRTEAGLRAFRSRCTHAGLPLDTALIEGGALVCRWHAHRFGNDTGACLTARLRPLEAWSLRIVDGLIWVRPTPPTCELAGAVARPGVDQRPDQE